MASTGKKGKKSKEKKLSLQDFLAKSNPQTGSSGTTQVAVQKYSSWAEECEEDEDRKVEIIQLPTAPRAARILDDNAIPNEGPFYARVSNLPFDISEADVDEFFLDQHIHIREMKLARDEQNDRLRGFGHIEFETRDDLLDAIMLGDPMIRNRRIRIEFTAEPDNSSGRTLRKRYDNYTPRDSANESTNWRDRKESNFEAVDSRENRENRRRNYQPRSTFQNRHESNNDNNDSNWRLGDRPNDSPPPERRRYGNDRRDGGDSRRDGGDRRGGGGRYNDREQREPEERPKLNIAPRTLPLPELNFPKEEELERKTRKISLNGDKDHSQDDSGLAEDDEENKEQAPKPKPTPVPRENVFGSAKPVDTTAREREIEEKMEQDRQEKLKAEKEKRLKERELSNTTSHTDNSNKDVIVIRTESSRRQQDDNTNWRKRDENSSNGSIDNKNRGGGGNRQIGRSDDRPRQFNKDNRDNRNNYNNRGGGGGGMNRDRRDNNFRRGGGGSDQGIRRSNDYHNSGGNEVRREEREPRRERNYELPKFVENSGPNLKTSNLFDGLDEEVNDD